MPRLTSIVLFAMLALIFMTINSFLFHVQTSSDTMSMERQEEPTAIGIEVQKLEKLVGNTIIPKRENQVCVITRTYQKQYSGDDSYLLTHLLSISHNPESKPLVLILLTEEKSSRADAKKIADQSNAILGYNMTHLLPIVAADAEKISKNYRNDFGYSYTDATIDYLLENPTIYNCAYLVFTNGDKFIDEYVTPDIKNGVDIIGFDFISRYQDSNSLVDTELIKDDGTRKARSSSFNKGGIDLGAFVIRFEAIADDPMLRFMKQVAAQYTETKFADGAFIEYAIKWQSLALEEKRDEKTVALDLLTTLQTRIKDSKQKPIDQDSFATKRTIGFTQDFGEDNLDFLMDTVQKKKTPTRTRTQNEEYTTPSRPTTPSKVNQYTSTQANEKEIVMQDSPSVLKFNDRVTRFKRDAIYNPHVPFTEGGGAKPTVSVLPGQQLHGYRYMYERLTDKGDALDDRITKFEPIILEAIRMQEVKMEEEIELSDPTSAHQGVVYAVGRVCCDSLIENAKFNQKSVMLEASKSTGVGSRVELNLDDVLQTEDGISLFPGQIIGVRGMNPSGREFNVSKIFNPNLLPFIETPVHKLLEIYSDTNSTSPLDIAIMSGPYCLEESLGYEPLKETIAHFIETSIPDIIILTGPFVDSMHPLIKLGDVDDFPDDIFKNNVSASLAELARIKPAVQYILIPTSRDVCLEWVCFPQPPLCSALSPENTKKRRQALGLDRPNYHLFPNPVQFRINELLFAISTTDILFHLNAASYIKQNKNINRIKSLAIAVLEQQHMYPLFPGKEGVYLELGRPEEMNFQARPDVLVLPCVLQAQCSEIEGVVWINPGPIARKHNGGNFVRMCVHALDIDGLRMEDEDVGVLAHLKDRVRVDLYKL